MSIPITHVLSRWGQSFSMCSLSANEFYALLELEISKHEYPNIEIKRVLNKEGGMLSASREYVRVKYKELVFEICAMSFGKDFFITEWIYETEGALKQLLKFTKAGEYLQERSHKMTFYQADQETMFKKCIHSIVIDVIDALTKNTSVRPLSEHERRLE